MGDIKLFSIHNQSAQELEGQAIAIEKSLQYTIEKKFGSIFRHPFFSYRV